LNRRALFLLIVLITLLSILSYVLYPVIRPPASDGVVHARREMSNTDVNPFGANFFLEREVEAWKREETVRMAREAGIGWAKQQFIWAEIEPQPGQYRWEKYDAIVDLCEDYGLQIVARLDGAPDWSREDNSMPGRPPDDYADYGEFVHRFVQHYKGRVRYVQIWNEPNLYIEWGNRPVDPAGYVELLKVAYERAKEADPNVYVLSAPLAITLGEPHPEPGKWRAMSDLQFLEEMYKAGAAAYLNILSVNAFGMDLPPDDPPSPGKLNFARVTLQREMMERYDDEHKPVWFNEYAWNAAPASFSEDELIWKRVTEEEQATYTLQGIEYARENWPWAGVFFIWYFRQVGNIRPDDAGYYFRMVDVDFSRPVDSPDRRTGQRRGGAGQRDARQSHDLYLSRQRGEPDRPERSSGRSTAGHHGRRKRRQPFFGRTRTVLCGPVRAAGGPANASRRQGRKRTAAHVAPGRQRVCASRFDRTPVRRRCLPGRQRHDR
jgi:hypothetical protein